MNPFAKLSSLTNAPASDGMKQYIWSDSEQKQETLLKKGNESIFLSQCQETEVLPSILMD